MIFLQVSQENVWMLIPDGTRNMKGVKQKYSGSLISMCKWHFLLIKIHKQAANVNGFCDSSWIFTFLDKWCIGRQSSFKITQSKLWKVSTALDMPFPGNFYISTHITDPSKIMGLTYH